MKIYIDADACPRDIAEIVYRAAERRGHDVVRVANRRLAAHASPRVTSIVADSSFDAADRLIAERVEAGDLVITGDIPLAAAIVAKGALGLSTRGEVYDEENVGTKLAHRDLMTELRSAGAMTSGPAPLNAADRRRFADGLDRLLTRLARSG